MDVHPTKNGINRYWSIPIYLCHKSDKPTKETLKKSSTLNPVDSYFFILIITICSQDAEISVLQIGFPTFPCQAAGAWQRALDALDQALYLHRCIDIYIVYPIFMSQRCLTLNKDDKPISIFFWGVMGLWLLGIEMESSGIYWGISMRFIGICLATIRDYLIGFERDLYVV